MADVKVKTAILELRVCKLTKAILKQIQLLNYEQMKPLLKQDGHEDASKVIGWIHGSVIGENYETYLLFSTGEGSYGLYSAMQQHREKYPQIYIA